MTVELNHTLVHVRDTWAAAREVAGVLGLAEPTSYGPFAVLQLDNGASLDFLEDTGDIQAQHYAFLVGEDDFDAIWAGSATRAGSSGPTLPGNGPARSTIATVAAASTGRVPTATGWRSSPVPTAAASRERARSSHEWTVAPPVPA